MCCIFLVDIGIGIWCVLKFFLIVLWFYFLGLVYFFGDLRIIIGYCGFLVLLVLFFLVLVWYCLINFIFVLSVLVILWCIYLGLLFLIINGF